MSKKKYISIGNKFIELAKQRSSDSQKVKLKKQSERADRKRVHS